ncbi:hypothetical protein K450DRAFT_217228 [Umbelopsis ramanniana AG]|uniref:Uncharacterized protein n=1 Tax=Umbelopsis ramanniana AG TaxID=1314678 RepID=A0AAD5EJP6_UMBRA|nr:uncharacterized protein K450DRAFT_217228 [Umbelopsis ramanniana AG]KAI8584637.1 hypothetical protein K450DRAFT_217228 [Umbelopsis ramanniana AG]
MKKFLGLTKPLDDDHMENRHRFRWSWRPRQFSSRRRTKSFAVPTEPSTPEKGLLPIRTNPEQALRHPLGGAIDSRNAVQMGTHDISVPVGNHPLAIPKDASRWTERDLKARTWPYQVAATHGDTSDDDDEDHSTDQFRFANIILTPPEEEVVPFPVQPRQSHPNPSSPTGENKPTLSNASPPSVSLPKDAAAPHNSSKNRSGDTMEKKVRNASMDSNPDVHQQKPSSACGSTSDYQTPRSSLDSLLPPPSPKSAAQQFSTWPRDTSTSDSFPAAINCAASFTFLPPGGRWRPGRDYKHAYLVNDCGGPRGT